MATDTELLENEEIVLMGAGLALAKYISAYTDMTPDEAVEMLTEADPDADSLKAVLEVAYDLHTEDREASVIEVIDAAAHAVALSMARVYLRVAILDSDDPEEIQDLGEKLEEVLSIFTEAEEGA